MPDDTPHAATAFLRGASEMAAHIRAFDWKATSLGPLESWPPSLRIATGLILQSHVPIVMLWGADGVMIYNDAYSAFAGLRHPRALGASALEVWPEVADFNANVLKVGLAGGTLSYKDQELTLYRSGEAEQVWMNLDYSPVLDETGEPAGVIAIVVETTQRVLADRAAAAEQARQRQLFSQMPGFVGVLSGSEHVFDYVNAAYVALCGARRFVGRSVREVFPELEGQGFFELLDAVYSTGETRVARGMPIRLADEPESRFIDFVYEPISDERGVVSGIFVGGYDATDVHRSAAALARSEEQLRLATDNAEIALWDVDLLTGAIFLPPRLRALLGIAPEVVVAMEDFYAAIHPDHHDAIRSATHLANDPAQRGVYDVEFRVSNASVAPWAGGSGGERWISAKGRGVFDGQGVCVRMIGTALDVTVRKQAEQRLRELNESLERQVIARSRERALTWQITPDLLSVLSSDGRFESVNPAWSALLDWSEDELNGSSCVGFLHPDDHGLTMAAFDRVRSGQPVFRFENRYRRRRGDYVTLSWVAVLEGERIYCTARDVTAEALARDELAVTQEALRQAQKMEAIGQLTGGIAHDFNNLLAGIGGSLELLRARIQQGRFDDAERYIAAATGSTQRAAALTQRLLAFSRRQTLDPKPIDANRLIAGVEDLIRRSVGPQVTVEVVGSVGLWLSLVDPSQLENALLNLAINARDAMPDGGRITIETANKRLDDRAGRERSLTAGDYLSICVSDTGTGMTPEVIARAFDPFFTTKPLGQGTGLGLSMIHGFARQSGGQVRIASQLGEGSTVCLYLPRFIGEPMTTADDDAAAAAVAGARSGETVLVIDDEPVVRMLIVEVLEEAGYHTLEAEDGASGLQILTSDAKIDLLLTDVGLPGGMNGRQVADAARAVRPTLRVLFVTGYAENATVGAGHLDAGMSVVTKPFAMADLASKVRETIDG